MIRHVENLRSGCVLSVARVMVDRHEYCPAAGIKIFLLGLLLGVQLISAQTADLATALPASQKTIEDQQRNQGQIRKDTLKVVYTGALFGYYRMEPNEEAWSAVLTPVQNWFKIQPPKSKESKIESTTHEQPTLLLGMGDNFGPEMGGSLQLENKDSKISDCVMPLDLPDGKNVADDGEKLYGTLTQKDVPLPIALYKDGVRVAKRAECDNVARFLIKAGYSAVVPGREDFLYSSTWLARIARDLQAAHQGPNDPLMLSANLQLKFKEAKPPTDGSFELRSTDYENVSPLLFTKCAEQDENVNGAGNTKEGEKRNQGCPVNLKKRESRKPGEVAATDTIVNEQENIGYTVVDLKDAAGTPIKVLVVGVIAKETMGAVSPANRQMCFLVTQTEKNKDSTRKWRSVACDVNKRKANEGLVVFDVEAADPVGPLIDILRATGDEPGNIAYRILMAQMPRGSAEELAAKLRTRMERDVAGNGNTHGPQRLYQFDLVVSEAQIRQGSPEVELNYHKYNDTWDLDPTVTPFPAYRQGRCDNGGKTDPCGKNGGYLSDGLFRPDSTVTLTTWDGGDAEKRTLINQPPRFRDMAVNSQALDASSAKASSTTETATIAVKQEFKDTSGKDTGDTAMHLLMAALNGVNKRNYAYYFPESPKKETADKEPDKSIADLASAENCEKDLTEGKANREQSEKCRAAITRYLLQTMQQLGHTDAALLEMRDIFTGFLPPGYDDYCSICDSTAGDEQGKKVCKLRVALDRVLWKGDYAEKVMISGKDIQSMLAKSKDLRDAEQTLNPRDTFDEWLVSFGIMARPEKPSASKSPAAAAGSNTATAANKALQTFRDELLASSGITGQPGKPSASQSPAVAGGSHTATAVNKGLRAVKGTRATKDFLEIPAGDCRIFSPSDFANPSSRSNYCVDGEAIRSDHAYFVVTSDHLANDKEVYTTVAGLPGNYKEGRQGYLTKDIADFLVHETGGSSSSYPKEGYTTEASESEQQERHIMQIDVAKAVVGYSARLPQSGDTNVEDKFQGASDTRASSPQSYEIDLEAKVRMLRKIWHHNTLSLAIGSQTDFTYDRSVQGNVSDNPVNASYPLNNFTAGPFLQFGLGPKNGTAGKNPGILAGRRMIVIAPFQFQRQIVGSYLFFPFSPPSKAELTLRSPYIHGFSHRLGYRGEATQWKLWDPGTYAEVGWQVAVQNNLLASATFSTPGSTPLPCPANSTLTINNCVKNAHLVINANTVTTEALARLHSQGLYWDIHWQKGLMALADKSAGITLMVDTAGDWFVPRDGTKSLSSQTQYDIPVKLTLAFPVLRNFSIGPTYSPFFYSNQVNHKSLIVQNFALNARWYFDRDAAVRISRQIVFKGPASADETKTARTK